MSCGMTMTRKADGPEPFRCTKTEGHWDSHTMVQGSTGKTVTLTNPCTGGRIIFLIESRV